MKTIIEQIRETTDNAITGLIPNLDAFLIINEILKEAEESKKILSKAAYDEIERIGEKDYQRYGYKCNLGVKTNWKFDHIPEWNNKKAELSAIEELAKIAAKTKLDVNSESGEQIIAAACTYSYFPNIKKA